MYRDCAGGTFHTTVGTGDIKVDIVCACCSGRKRNISGVVSVVFGTCDCPIVTVSATRIAIQLHLLAKAVGGITRDTGGWGIEESDILHTFFLATIRISDE